MTRKSAWKVAAGALMALLTAACQTKQPVEPTTPDPVRAGDPLVFHPATPLAPIQFEGGRYPILFGGGSHATWVEPAPPAATAPAAPVKTTAEGMDKDAPAMLSERVVPAPVDAQTRSYAANFNVVTCDIESAFTDTALAYDAVGFRNVEVYLQSPDGQKISPVQRIIGADLDTESVGALKKYHRKNILLFPKQSFPVATPLEGAPAPGVRLVLEGYGSKFYFQWAAQTPADIGAPPLKDQEWVKKGEENYRKAHQKERAVLHKFD